VVKGYITDRFLEAGHPDGLEPEEIESMGLAISSDQADEDNPSQ